MCVLIYPPVMSLWGLDFRHIHTHLRRFVCVLFRVLGGCWPVSPPPALPQLGVPVQDITQPLNCYLQVSPSVGGWGTGSGC